MTHEPLSLFDEAARPPFGGSRVETVALSVRRTDPETSTAAAWSLTPGHTEAAVLDAFCGLRGVGYTDDELAAALAPQHYGPTVKSARSRLSHVDERTQRPALLVDSGTRRPSVRGRDQIVWRLAHV